MGNLRKIILRHYLDAIINISDLFCYIPANLQLQRKARRGRQVKFVYFFILNHNAFLNTLADI